jgi:uncharacterized protein
MTPINKGKILLPIARSSISEALGVDHESIEDSVKSAEWLQQKAACFVTLTQQDQLRGCIGTLEAHRPLLDDVTHNARAAAFQDPRFSPLTSEELGRTEIEISLLSAMQAMNFSDEQDALEQLQPGIDGLVFEFDRYRSTFLPQVWEQLPEVTDFIAHLKQKAGLPADFWADDVRLYRYSVSKWKERDFETPAMSRTA